MPGLNRFSIGVGDRFGREGESQLRAVQNMAGKGLEITPVWNKSNREHEIVRTTPGDVRREADAAVAALGWDGAYFVDADHINARNVGPFVAASDFFTLDVADAIGQAAPPAEIDHFLDRHADMAGELTIPGIGEPISLNRDDLADRAKVYLAAVGQAAALYKLIAGSKGNGDFVTEVSMDECETPQTPADLAVILAALADEGVPVATLAPKFSGRFNKGVDYVGDTGLFAREFEADVCVLRWAVDKFGLPPDLKLSVHSGSDKFAIYGPMAEVLKRHRAGVHLKTAGTTWLEEIIGLSEAGGDGLEVARDIYRLAFGRFDELCAPYAMVIDIDPGRLPDPAVVATWDGARLAASLRHDQDCPHFNPDLRQFLHVSYKIAVEMGERFPRALADHAGVVGRQVEENLYRRHMLPLFGPAAEKS